MNTFWHILDEVLNAVLFVLIGLEILVLGFDVSYMILAVVAIPVVLLARYLAVWLTNIALPKAHKSTGKELMILSWAGLRGGISIALALTLTEDLNRAPILYMTYVIVIFSIIVQGLSVGTVVKKLKT